MKDNNSLAVWNVKEDRFPKNGKLKAKLKFLIRYAILAASGLNSQPWKFMITDRAIEVRADRDRRRPEIDPEDRELYISLGCAITNLEVAARYFGMIFKKIYDEGSGDRAVIFEFSEGKMMSTERELFKSIIERRVNREEYNIRQITGEIREVVIKESNKDGLAKLYLTNQKELQEELAELIGKSNRIWFKSKELVEEMKYWLKNDLDYGKEKLPAGAFNLDKIPLEVAKKAEREKRVAKEAAALGIIWSKSDTKTEWIKTGEVYERMALKLTEYGIQNAFFNTVVELKTQRKKLVQMLGIKGQPQLIFRVGYSDREVSHSGRRPIGEVIL